ncbi:MAG: hypothetical protein IKT40_12320 [Bacilli bacterium]|nr:hypothetical protein [Bacilli bacterium]
MAVYINTIEDAEKSIISSIKNHLSKVVTDINFEDSIKSFLKKGGYDFNKSLKENIDSCIQYIAIRKARLNI